MSVKTLTKRFYIYYLIKGQWKGNRISAKEAYKALQNSLGLYSETLLISMISFIDTVMVSTLGHEAVAAVGLTTQREYLLCCFLRAECGRHRCSQQAQGRGKQRSPNKPCRRRFSEFDFGCHSFCGFLLSQRGFSSFMGAQDDTIHLAVPYFRIIMLGTVFTSVGLMINARRTELRKPNFNGDQPYRKFG